MAQGNCERCGTWRWLQRHHLRPQAEGGTDADGVLLLCANCHEDVHDGPMGGESTAHLRHSPESNGRRAVAMREAWADPEQRERRLLAPQHQPTFMRAISPLGHAARATESDEARERRRETHRVAALVRHADKQERDEQILALKQDGLTYLTIAKRMGLSESAVQGVIRRRRVA